MDPTYLQIKPIKDENDRKGFFLEKEKKYWKAWFHKNIQRWDPLKYGEEGQNFEEWILKDKEVCYLIFAIPKYGQFLLEIEDFKKFYLENPMILDTIFQSKRFLFPLSLCKKIKQ